MTTANDPPGTPDPRGDDLTQPSTPPGEIESGTTGNSRPQLQDDFRSGRDGRSPRQLRPDPVADEDAVTDEDEDDEDEDEEILDDDEIPRQP